MWYCVPSVYRHYHRQSPSRRLYWFIYREKSFIIKDDKPYYWPSNFDLCPSFIDPVFDGLLDKDDTLGLVVGVNVVAGVCFAGRKFVIGWGAWAGVESSGS
jgi:hypothetical protein